MPHSNALALRKKVPVPSETVMEGLDENKIIGFAELEDEFGRDHIVKNFTHLVQTARYDLDCGMYDKGADRRLENTLTYVRHYFAARGMRGLSVDAQAAAFDMAGKKTAGHAYPTLEDRLRRDTEHYNLWQEFLPTRWDEIPVQFKRPPLKLVPKG